MNDHPSDRGNKRIHPGSGRRKAPKYPKGRFLDPQDLAAVEGLLGGREIKRDELIEYLHLVQDSEGCLPAGHLHALAEIM